MKDYLTAFEAVSVYANAIQLLIPHLKQNQAHLDIGCGGGAISAKIVEYGSNYIGLDINESALERLKDKGFEAYKIDLLNPSDAIKTIENIANGLNVCSVSMLDVIEHLPQSNEFLYLLSKWMASHNPEGVLITSIPNFSHLDICTRLMGGHWDYTDSGLLDKTHITVFTEQFITKLLNNSGWHRFDSKHYELYNSDQRTTLPIIYAANTYFGIGQQIRGIKRSIDPNYQIHQFVDIWKLSHTLKTETHRNYSPHKSSTSSPPSSKNNQLKPNQFQVISWDKIDNFSDLIAEISSEYLIFSNQKDFDDHPIIETISETLNTNDRPVLLIDESGETGQLEKINISPGPWLAIPSEFFIHHFTNTNIQKTSPEEWKIFIIKALIICGHSVKKERHLKSRNISLLQESLSIYDIHKQGLLDKIILSVWPDIDKLAMWLRYPTRFENEEHVKFIDHLQTDINTLNKALTEQKYNFTEIQHDRLRIKAELEDTLKINIDQAKRISHIESELAKIETSIIWRLTKPLRALFQLFRSQKI